MRESSTAPAPTRTSPRRPVELVAICADHRGAAGLAIAVTISKSTGMHRRVIPHDDTPQGLADALYAASEWIRAGAPHIASDLFNAQEIAP